MVVQKLAIKVTGKSEFTYQFSQRATTGSTARTSSNPTNKGLAAFHHDVASCRNDKGLLIYGYAATQILL